MVEEYQLQEWQLIHALCTQTAQGQNHQPLGELLVELGYSTSDLVSQALVLQKNEATRQCVSQENRSPAQVPRLGELLLQAGVIQKWQQPIQKSQSL